MKKLFYLFAMFTLIGLAACGDDEPDVKYSDTSLSYGKTYTIPGGVETTWTSSNDLVASIEGNIVTAEHVGTAVISSDKGTFKVTVTPTSNAYKEPCMEWGANKNKVKSFMNGYTGVTLDTDDATSLTYFGTATQPVLMVSYSFEKSALNHSGIALNSDYIATNSLTSFLLERYVPVSTDEDNYSFYFINPDMNMAVLLQLTTISRTVVFMVVYAPVDLSSRSSLNIESLFDGFNVPAPAFDLSDTFEDLQNNL